MFVYITGCSLKRIHILNLVLNFDVSNIYKQCSLILVKCKHNGIIRRTKLIRQHKEMFWFLHTSQYALYNRSKAFYIWEIRLSKYGVQTVCGWILSIRTDLVWRLYITRFMEHGWESNIFVFFHIVTGVQEDSLPIQ